MYPFCSYMYVHLYIEELKGSRYKIIVQTVIGKMNDQGFRFASRCLWNASTDNYTSTSYNNVRLYCIVYACYYYFTYLPTLPTYVHTDGSLLHGVSRGSIY